MKIVQTTIKSLQTTMRIRNKEINFKNIIPYIMILLFTSLLSCMSCSRLKNVGLFWDAAVYLNVSRNILRGKILYKEIVDNKGPILYIINAIGLKIGGQNGVVIIEFLFIFVALLFMYKSSKLICKSKSKSILTTLIAVTYFARFFTFGLTCEQYGLTFSMIALYMCLQYYNDNSFSKKQCFMLGILCGLTFFIRPNLIIVFVAFAIGIGLELIIEKKIKELIKYIIFSLCGFLCICTPIFMYFIKNNCLNDFINNVFLMNLTMNKLGVSSSIKEILHAMPITFILIIVYLCISVYKLIIQKNKKYLSIIFLVIITIWFNCISKEIYEHYLIMFIPLLLLMFSELIGKKNNGISKVFLLVIYYVALCIVIANIIVAINYINIPQHNKIIIEYIKDNSNENDKIAVLGFSDELYYLSNRESVSKYTYILSNDAFSRRNQINILNEYFGDIIEKKPVIIIENLNTMTNGVCKYISLEEYEQLKDEYYICDEDLLTFRIYKKVIKY